MSSVDIIGCPSLYLHGPELAVAKRRDRLDTDSRIALNITPSKAAFARLVDAATHRFPNLTYIPQEHHDLAMMMWGEEQIAVRHTDPRIPTHLGHPLYTGNRMRFFVDAVPWIDHLRGYDYAFGTRLHGNIAALLAGIPATVIAHDSRTAELARYHGIPHRGLAAIDETTTVEELYDEADLADFHRLYPEGFAAYRAFLDRNRVPHVFDEATRTGAEDFDARLAAVPFPPAVQVAAADPAKTDIYARLRWLRQGSAVDKYRSVDGYQPAFAPGVAETGLDRAVPDIQRLTAKVEALTRQVAALQKQATRQSQAARPLWRRAGSRVKRIVGK